MRWYIAPTATCIIEYLPGVTGCVKLFSGS